MLFKFNGQEIEVPDDFMVKCGEHAEERGMTLEEYIAEAFTMYKNQLDNTESCGGVPAGWIPKDEV